MRPRVALVTDFGAADSYVAEMKQAMRALVPDVAIDDVAHELPAYDLAHAALLVERTLRGLPRGAAMAVVVDPGVGSERRRIAVEHDGRWLVGPDNGVLPTHGATVWTITRWAPRAGVRTFDGREVFGPVAALLAAGLAPSLLGPRCAVPVPWVIPDAIIEDRDGWRYARAAVIAHDRYGNAVTSLLAPPPAAQVTSPAAWAGPLRAGYATVARGEPLALVGSSGRVELARREAPAGVTRGEEVVLRWPVD